MSKNDRPTVPQPTEMGNWVDPKTLKALLAARANLEPREHTAGGGVSPASKATGEEVRRASDRSEGKQGHEQGTPSGRSYPPRLTGRLRVIEGARGQTAETIADNEARQLRRNAGNPFDGELALGDPATQEEVREITRKVRALVPRELSDFASFLGKEISGSAGSAGRSASGSESSLACRSALRDLALLSEALGNVDNAINIRLKTNSGEDITANIPSQGGPKATKLADITIATPKSVAERQRKAESEGSADGPTRPGIYVSVGESVFAITLRQTRGGKWAIFISFGPSGVVPFYRAIYEKAAFEKPILRLTGDDPMRDFALFEAGVVKVVCTRTMSGVRDETIAGAMNIPVPERVLAQSGQMWDIYEKGRREEEAAKRRRLDRERELAPPASDILSFGPLPESSGGRKFPTRGEPPTREHSRQIKTDELFPELDEYKRRAEEKERAAKSRESDLRRRGPGKDLWESKKKKKVRVERKAPPYHDKYPVSYHRPATHKRTDDETRKMPGDLEAAVFEREGLMDLMETQSSQLGVLRVMVERLNTLVGQMLESGDEAERRARTQSEDRREAGRRKEGDTRQKTQSYLPDLRPPESDRFGPSRPRGARIVRPTLYQ